MGTRCSGRSPKLGAGADTWGNDEVGTPVGIEAADLAPPATAASTSPLVTRPSLPDPATEPAANWLSAISLAAAGIATPAMEEDAGAEAAELAAGAAATGTAEADGAGDAAPAATLPSVSMRAISCSAMTVPPSVTKISDTTPADGAGTSNTTLSVSISIRIWSDDTASPTLTFHCNMVASDTDSDS